MKRPRVHLICNAHLDPVWQWQWEEGCAEALSTFRVAVDILREHEDLVFNHNESVLYRWVQDYDPELFDSIQELVADGRWSISGGWYLQPDVNMPDTEALIRQITEGREFFKRYFDVEPKVAYNFDSFGHSGGLPQILRLTGYKMYIHMRPQEPEMHLPSDLYRWRGVDGSEIPCLRISVGLYHTERDNIEQRMRDGVELALKLNRDVPVFWGIGDHGGGATREDLRRIDEFMRNETRADIIHSTPDRLWAALSKDAECAPVFKGDLQRVFTGCYTSLSRIKRRSQSGLAQLVQTEALRTATWWLHGQSYPETQLEEAWRDHLFNDFHDILPGTCIEPAENDALDLYGCVSESVRRLRFGAVASFNGGKKRSYYLPVSVLNANPSCTRVPVEFDFMLDHRPRLTGDWYVRLHRMDDTEIVCQEEQPESLLPFNGWRRKISFMADLPGLGCAKYHLEVCEGKKPSHESNAKIAHSFGPNGFVNSMYDHNNRQCLAGDMLSALVVRDEGDSWGASCWNYRDVVGRFEVQPDLVRVIEDGPVRTITETISRYNLSKIVMRTIAYSDWPVIEYRLRVHWNEECKMLKLAIPTTMADTEMNCEVPGGAIQRPADGQEQLQGRWLMLANAQDTAIGIVNNGQHGFDVANGEVRISALRGTAYCREKTFALSDSPARKYADQGVHDIHLLVTVGSHADVARTLPGLADWVSAAPSTYAHMPIGSYADGSANIDDLLAIDAQNVRLLAFKRSRDGAAVILRVQESAGRATATNIRLAEPRVSAAIDLKPFEIRTLRFEKSGQWAEADIIGEEFSSPQEPCASDRELPDLAPARVG